MEKLNLKRMIVTLLFISSVAGSAERMVHFSGSLMSLSTTVPIANSNVYSTCGITLTNMGAAASKQRLKAGSLQVVQFTPGGAGYTSAKTSTPDEFSYSLFGSLAPIQSASSDDPCSQNSIISGGACLIRWKNVTLPSTEALGTCAGTLSVLDEDSTHPGSMMASGSIFLWQETMVLGGVLSAAHYYSGTHLKSLTGINLDSSVSYQVGLSGPAPIAGQMNIYCSSACAKFQISKGAAVNINACNEICGVGGYTGSLAPKEMPFPSASFGWVNQSAPLLFAGLTPIPFSTAAPPTPKPGNPSFTLNIANGLFAGGLVTEMVYGPLTSICSANQEYWDAGEVDFTFPAFVTNNVTIKGSGVAGAPPQRLLCSQRHGRQDLFIRTGSVANFLVNGGLPF